MSDYLDQLQGALTEMKRRRATLDADIDAVVTILERHGIGPDNGRPASRGSGAGSPDLPNLPEIFPTKRTPRRGETRDAILVVMGDGSEHSPKEVAETIHKPRTAVSAAMQRMAKDGLLQSPGYARYFLPQTAPDSGTESGAATPDEVDDHPQRKGNSW